MKKLSFLILGAALSGCGADGEPVQPTRHATITLSDSGLSAATRIGVTQGPVSLSLGLGL